jgi:ribosomal protein S18 acetylase RimI-like enzyme
MAVTIEVASEVTDELIDAFARLVPQLSSAPPPTAAELADVVGDRGNTVFVARVDGRIIGTLTLATFRIPTGLRARIEDVVVDEAGRGQRISERMSRAALDKAKELGAKTVDLTSSPSRLAANHIYRQMGFVERDTNVWRFTVEP